MRDMTSIEGFMIDKVVRRGYRVSLQPSMGRSEVWVRVRVRVRVMVRVRVRYRVSSSTFNGTF